MMTNEIAAAALHKANQTTGGLISGIMGPSGLAQARPSKPMNPSGFTPLDMRVVVLPDPPETHIGSIRLTDAEIERRKWAQTKATLIAAGDNAFKDWASATVPKPGDRIVVGQYTGKTHKGADGREYTICNDEDILALMEE